MCRSTNAYVNHIKQLRWIISSHLIISVDSPWLLYPGLGLIAVNGMVIKFTNTQFSLLFNTRRQMVVGLMEGSFDSAVAAMQLFKVTANSSSAFY